MSPTPYLELEGVAAHLGERRVFHNLSLQLNLGEHTVVLGPNGAGKSALVKLSAARSIRWFNRDQTCACSLIAR